MNPKPYQPPEMPGPPLPSSSAGWSIPKLGCVAGLLIPLLYGIGYHATVVLAAPQTNCGSAGLWTLVVILFGCPSFALVGLCVGYGIQALGTSTEL